LLLATETPVAEKPAEEESSATVITTVTLTRNTYAKHPRFSAEVFRVCGRFLRHAAVSTSHSPFLSKPQRSHGS